MVHNLGDKSTVSAANNNNNHAAPGMPTGTPLRLAGSGHHHVYKDAAASVMRSAANGNNTPTLGNPSSSSFKTPQSNTGHQHHRALVSAATSSSAARRTQLRPTASLHHSVDGAATAVHHHHQQQQPATVSQTGSRFALATAATANNSSFVIPTPAKNLFGGDQNQQEQQQQQQQHSTGRLRASGHASKSLRQQAHQQQAQQQQQHLSLQQRIVALIDEYKFPIHRQPRTARPMHRNVLLRNGQFSAFGARAPTLTVVLDLDETLVNNRLPNRNDALLRPHVLHFLNYVRGLGNGIELVLWTASTSDTAGPVVRQLSASGGMGGMNPFDECIFRSPDWFTAPFHTKDLRLLGRDMRRVVLVDNSPNCCKFAPHHSILVEDFVEQRPHQDEALICVGRIIAKLFAELSADDEDSKGSCVPSALNRLASEGELCTTHELKLNDDWAALESMDHIDPLMIPPHGPYVRAHTLHPRVDKEQQQQQQPAVAVAEEEEPQQPDVVNHHHQHHHHHHAPRFRVVSNNMQQQQQQQQPMLHARNQQQHDENDLRWAKIHHHHQQHQQQEHDVKSL